jgi:flavin reductase (DIM6/NTAB) family NADH-FMN oxidoreductase RutF
MPEIDCANLAPREVYQLLTRMVAPRPIAFVSTRNLKGQGNLAPFSYFTIGGSNPPSLVFCPLLNRERQKKDTLLNIEETGEYVINIATLEMAGRLNQASFPYPHGVDEFDQVGFTRSPSRKVAPPGVAESPINLEMRLHTIVRHGDGPLASNYVIGELVYIHLRDEVLTDGLPDNRKLAHLARLGEEYYSAVSADSLISIPRPTQP